MPRAYEGREKPAISPSELESAMMCLHRSHLEQTTGRRRQTLPMARGSAVHYAAKLDAQSKMVRGKPLDAATLREAAADSFDRSLGEEVYLFPKEVSKGKEQAIGSERDRAVHLTTLYADIVSPRLKPDLAEERLFIDIEGGAWDLTGQLDQASRPSLGVIVNEKIVPLGAFETQPRGGVTFMPGSGVLWDFKTRARARGQDAASQSIQLTMYAALYKRAVGRFPGRIELVDLVQSPRRSYVHTVITSRNEASVGVLVQRINAYAKILKAGVTMPAPIAAWWCGPNACAFWNECPFVDSQRLAAAVTTEEEN